MPRFEKPENGNDIPESVSSQSIERDRTAEALSRVTGKKVESHAVLDELKNNLERARRLSVELKEKEDGLSKIGHSKEGEEALAKLYARDRQKLEAEIDQLEAAVREREAKLE